MHRDNAWRRGSGFLAAGWAAGAVLFAGSRTASFGQSRVLNVVAESPAIEIQSLPLEDAAPLEVVLGAGFEGLPEPFVLAQPGAAAAGQIAELAPAPALTATGREESRVAARPSGTARGAFARSGRRLRSQRSARPASADSQSLRATAPAPDAPALEEQQGAQVQLEAFAEQPPALIGDGFDGAHRRRETEPVSQGERLAAMQDKVLIVVGYAVGPQHQKNLEMLTSAGVKVILVYLRESDEAEDIYTRYPPEPFVEKVVRVDIPAKDGETHQERRRRLARLSVEAVERAGIRGDGILSFVEDDVDVSALMAQRWGLRHMSYEAVQALRDKANLPVLAARAGLPVLASLRVRLREGEVDEGDLERALREVGVPAVLKPATGGSSDGVVKVRTVAEAREQARRLARKIHAESAARSDGMVHNETFDPDLGITFARLLEGRQISVDFALRDGELLYGRIADNHRPRRGSAALTGLTLPSTLGNKRQARALKEAVALARAAGAEDGIFHFEIIIDGHGDMYVVDANPRVPGRPFVPFHQEVFGVNLVLEHAMIALGIRGRPAASPKPMKHIYGRILFPPRAGTLLGIRGWEDARQADVVWASGVGAKAPGEPLQADPLKLTPVALYAVEGNTPREARRNYAEQRRRHDLRVEVAPAAPSPNGKGAAH